MTRTVPLHVLMINSGKSEAVDELRLAEPSVDLDVITEAGYAKQYPADVRLHFVADIGDLDAVRALALDLQRQRPIDRVLSPSERSQQPAGYLRTYLGLPGIGYEVANRFSNKAVMKRALTDAGIAVAEHRIVYDTAEVEPGAQRLGWPVVVKPALGTGSMNTVKADDAGQWREHLASEASAGLRRAVARCPLLVERFVEMTGEYHCDGVVREGRVEFAAVSRYFMPLLGEIDAFTGSYVLPTGDPRIEAIGALHSRTVRALGLRDGVTHLEVFETRDGFLVGEIACRPAGGGIVEAVRLQFGVDLWRVSMDSALGRPLVLPEPAARLRPEIVVNCDLPIRPGRVLRISGANELAGLPGVISSRMSIGPGDVIGSRLHSASTTGLVFLAVEDEDAVGQRVRTLTEAYVLEVEQLRE